MWLKAPLESGALFHFNLECGTPTSRKAGTARLVTTLVVGRNKEQDGVKWFISEALQSIVVHNPKVA